MSHLSIRQLPGDIEKALEHEAKVCGKTKSQIVLEALAERFHLSPQDQKKAKLKSFSGKLSKEDFSLLQKALEDFDTIDPSLWSLERT